MRGSAVAVVACGVLFAAFLVFLIGGWGGENLRIVVIDAVYVPMSLLALVLAVRVVRMPGIESRSRLAWGFIAAAFGCRFVAHAAWFVEDGLLRSNRYPSMADYWFLVFVPFMLIGLLLLPAAQRTRTDRIKLTLDSLIVGASGFMVLWYLVLGPLVDADQTRFTGLAYSAALPIGELLLVLALVTSLLRRSTGADTPMRLLALAVVAFVVADTSYAYFQLHDGFVSGMWPDLFWSTGCYLLVLAAHQRRRQNEQVATAGRKSRINWLPYGAIALAYTLLAVIAGGERLYPLGGMILGAILLTSLVVARQMYALRENRVLAVTDGLTGLANRTLVNERLALVSQQNVRDGRYAAVLLIDLDRFKPINDTYGHEAGDAVLCAVATAMRSVIRAGDTAGRLGGDEFAVILQNLPARAVAEQVAQRLVDALRTPVIVGENVLEVEASIGVAIRDQDSTDAERLLQHADTAMYAAKRSGRGRYQLYTPELDLRAREAELRAAVANGELVVHYQPAVDLRPGKPRRIVAVEALVRWNHPVRGLLMPGAFIDLAEETGAVVEVGEWVLREACRQVAGWYEAMPGARDVRLSVNLSPKQVVQPTLVDVIRTILAETGFPAGHLVLEITEGVVLEPDEFAVARLKTLSDMGIRLAVDDFGTGYSALSYLRRLPVDILKIDRSFVTDLADDPEARTVAEAVVRLGMAFRMDVVAEGIETAEQARELSAMGCGFGQGYHFYRPLDGPAAAAALRASADQLLAGG
ncbi:bifunctional diguanylate cyclase/phosphodiesterase [Actinoplanes sp. N902-109]|uniref:putative bifunctional diguanylate cyclase/phosphodiesterase n=1 Tax=Actinoplanes sp. (strain N902-109) TaxID=649831 RepID=UPI0003293D47|nr:EAL domain-containing protein [Actinoplanes sp. N902-109]AGL18016.1 diguanylate cyclase/phosphodiesterase [Actinoplanes sp. N902-109]